MGLRRYYNIVWDGLGLVFGVWAAELGIRHLLYRHDSRIGEHRTMDMVRLVTGVCVGNIVRKAMFELRRGRREKHKDLLREGLTAYA